MWKWFANAFKSKNKIELLEVPDQWIMTSLGQSIKDGTWFCEMLWAKRYLDTGQDCIVFTEEHYTAKQAIEHAIIMIEKQELNAYNQQTGDKLNKETK